MPAPRSLPLVLTLAASLLLTSCTLGPSQRPALATFGAPATGTSDAPPSSTAPLGPGGPGQRADPIRWNSCRDVPSVDAGTGMTFTVDCASVELAGSGSSFGGRTIEVARARAAGVAADAPAIVVVQGEPGQQGRSAVAAAAAGLSPAVREHFSVIAVDLPGTGESDPIDCLTAFDARTLTSLGVDPTESAAASTLAELSRTLTFECGDLAGPDLSLANSTGAADALDGLRAALGTPTLTLIGRGFGATLAAVYADRYPGRVGAAVLDAPSDPLEDPTARATAVAVAAEKAIDALAAGCPSFDGGCPLGPDPRAQIDKAVSALDDAPGANPGSGRTNGGSVLLTLLLRLGDKAGWPELATALNAAAGGDGQQIEKLLTDSLGGDGGSDWLNAAIIYGCNDTALRISQEQMKAAVDQVRADAPLLGPFTIGLLGVCTSWPAPEAALGAVKATGAAPILITAAVDDPVAPYAAVRSLAGQLGSATLISWQSGQHGSYPESPCVTAAVDSYLLTGDLPGVGTLCPP